MQINICDIASIAGVFVLIVHSMAYNCRRSRCYDIKCLCVHCKRQLMNKEELAEDHVPAAAAAV